MLIIFFRGNVLLSIILFLFFCKTSLSSCNIDSLESIVNSNIDVCRKTEILLEHINGILAINQNNLEELSKKTLNEAKILKDEKAEANSYYLLAEPHHLNFQYKAALRYYRKALLLYDNLGCKEEIANTHKNIGICCYYTSDYESALESHNMALRTYKEIGAFREVSKILSNIGILYNKLQKEELALNYFKESYKILIECKDTNRLPNLFLNMGIAYRQKGDYEKAIESYEESLRLYLKSGRRVGVAKAYTNIGLIYNLFNQFDESLLYFRKALFIYEELNQEEGIIETLINIGTTYHDMSYYAEGPVSRNYEIALENYNKALLKAQSIERISSIISIYEAIHNTYKIQSDYEKSLYYYKKHVTLKDSIFNEKKYAQTLVLEEQLQRENSNVEKEFEEKIVVIENNNRIRLRLLFIMNVVTLLLTFFFVYKYFQLRKRALV